MYLFKYRLFVFLSIYFFLFSVVSCTKAPKEFPEDNSIVNVKEEATLNETISSRIPHLYIDIADNEEVLIKDQYLVAELAIEGDGIEFAAVSTRIKGRGNSTWSKPKKPYRLKLDKAVSILGLPAAKDWVLLANYNDYTLMTNAVAMKIGKQLGMPYTHDIIPVDLTVNGIYRGNYNLTQQVEIHENRVNVGENGILWELDSYYDEDWKFKSIEYSLPVMLKGPKVESELQFSVWKNDFNQFVEWIKAKSFPSNEYNNIFDKQQFVNFLLVNMLVGNHEICHPKSVFIHKKQGGKYTMGPLWDFDFAFGFSEEFKRTYFNYVDLSLIRDNDDRLGTVFYRRLLVDKEVKSLFRKTWDSYKANKFNELMDFVEVFAASIRESQKLDYEKWKVGNNKHAENKADLKTFLRHRTKSIDKFVKDMK